MKFEAQRNHFDGRWSSQYRIVYSLIGVFGFLTLFIVGG